MLTKPPKHRWDRPSETEERYICSCCGKEVDIAYIVDESKYKAEICGEQYMLERIRINAKSNNGTR